MNKGVSLDTNIFILGLRGTHPSCVAILDNLWQFQVKIAPQVERELRHNLNQSELKLFYRLVYAMPTIELNYQIPPDSYYQRYRQVGLKMGDAYIAAFCDWQGISWFISENRHFLKFLPDSPFKVVNAPKFCDTFLLK